MAITLVLLAVLTSGTGQGDDPRPVTATAAFPALTFTSKELDDYTRRTNQQVASWTFLGIGVAAFSGALITTTLAVNAVAALRSQVVPIDLDRRAALLGSAESSRAAASVSFGVALVSVVLWAVLGTESLCKAGQPGCL